MLRTRPLAGQACEEVPSRQRETSKGNSETSLAKVRILRKLGRLKATERLTGVESLSRRRCGRLPNLHPLCRQWRRECIDPQGWPYRQRVGMLPPKASSRTGRVNRAELNSPISKRSACAIPLSLLIYYQHGLPEKRIRQGCGGYERIPRGPGQAYSKCTPRKPPLSRPRRVPWIEHMLA